MLDNAKWISYPCEPDFHAPVFRRFFSAKDIKKAKLRITSHGCYYATINGCRVGDFILAPGCTSFKRVQMQTYDITDLLEDENELSISLSKGWFKGKCNWRRNEDNPDMQPCIICEIELTGKDGKKDFIVSDEKWESALSKITFTDIYDGEHYDATYEEKFVPCRVLDYPKDVIVPQQGEKIVECEVLRPHAIFKTPKGETVIDFNQNLTGYFEISLNAKNGDVVSFSVGEVLDKDGNFYNENYRSAKSEFVYTCKDGKNVYKPRLTFYGFRYLRVNSFPDDLTFDSVKAIVVHSDMKRTGYLKSSSALLNKLFSNTIWGQKGNFLDIPTDCPQRDERMGWTGDAQIFIKTATYNYDVERFFEKWLEDMRIEQTEDGAIQRIVPQHWNDEPSSAGWGDAVAVCPYQLYLSYGNKKILKKMYPSMCRYLSFMANLSSKKYLWTGCVHHFGDWLGLDAPEGSYKGSTDVDFIASAFYYYSTCLTVKVGKVIGKNVSKYEALKENILKALRENFKTYKTQTECVLALHFDIADDKKAVAKQLADMIIANKKRLQTGFIGTPYLLHALSNNGYTELAYDLLLQENYPSWLYSVKQGATTIWEHWDGVNDRGEFWSKDMNSFNHYAYGSVCDWVYEFACGIKTDPEKVGYEQAIIEPHSTKKLDSLGARYETRYGTIISEWYKEGNSFRYEITIPVKSTVIIEGKKYVLEKGKYIF